MTNEQIELLRAKLNECNKDEFVDILVRYCAIMYQENIDNAYQIIVKKQNESIIQLINNIGVEL